MEAGVPGGADHLAKFLPVGGFDGRSVFEFVRILGVDPINVGQVDEHVRFELARQKHGVVIRTAAGLPASNHKNGFFPAAAAFRVRDHPMVGMLAKNSPHQVGVQTRGMDTDPIQGGTVQFTELAGRSLVFACGFPSARDEDKARPPGHVLFNQLPEFFEKGAIDPLFGRNQGAAQGNEDNGFSGHVAVVPGFPPRPQT